MLHSLNSRPVAWPQCPCRCWWPQTEMTPAGLRGWAGSGLLQKCPEMQQEARAGQRETPEGCSSIVYLPTKCPSCNVTSTVCLLHPPGRAPVAPSQGFKQPCQRLWESGALRGPPCTPPDTCELKAKSSSIRIWSKPRDRIWAMKQPGLGASQRERDGPGTAKKSA